MRKVAFLFLLLIASLVHGEDMTDALRFTAPKKWALVIGASDYESMGKLKYSVNDARAFSNVLESHLGFTRDTVTLLTDDPQGQNKPTSKNILAALDGLLADPTLDQGDLFIFYFSGHGVGLASGDYLAPTDATMETVAKAGLPVKQVIKRIVDKGLKNVLFIADACRSGEKNPFGDEVRELCQKANLAVFLSCAPGKRSYELASEQQGAFTHSLIQKIKDRSTYDEFETLWASELAAVSSKATFATTEPTYGKYAQNPVAFNLKSRDLVLVNALSPDRIQFIEKVFSEDMDGKVANRIDAKYCAYLRVIAEIVGMAGKDALAVNFFQRATAMEPLTPRARFAYGIFLGRSGDISGSTKVLAELAQQNLGLFSDLASLLLPLDKFPLDKRSAASMRVFLASKIFPYAEGAYDFAPNLGAKKSMVPELLKNGRADSKEGIYWQGRLAMDALKNEEAKPLFLKSAAMPGDADVTHYALFHLNRMVKETMDVDTLLTVWEAGMKVPGRQVFWAFEMAEFMRDLDRQRAIDALIKYIDPRYQPSPSDLFRAVELAGLGAGQLVPALKRFATIYPYSPEYRMSLWIAEFFEHPKQFFDLPDFVTEVATDPVEIRYDAFFAMWRGFNEQKDIQLIQKLAMGGEFVSSLVPYQDKFGKNDLVWRELIEWGVPANRQLQVYRLAEKHLFPFVLTGKAEGILASQALKIAMNMGADAMAEKIYRAYDWDKVGRDEERLRYAAYLAVRGKLTASKAELARTKRRGNLRGYYELYDGLQYLYKLSDKKTDALLKEFEAWDPGGDIGMNIKGYVGALFTNDVKHINYLGVCVDYYNPEFWYLSAACLQQMEKNLRTLKEAKPDDTNQTRMGWVWLQAGHGTAFHRESGYVVDAALADYTGTYKFSYSYIYEPERAKGNQDGSVELSIAADGKASATVALAKGKTLALTGTIDKWGNLALRSADGWEMTAKIPPQKMLDKIDMLQKFDQQFALLDPKLDRMVGSAKPVKGE